MYWDLIKDGRIIAWLQQRPAYCDRGRYHAGFEVAFWRSDADRGVRYYFDLECAKSEVVAYLQAKKIDVAGAEWIPSQPKPLTKSDCYQ